MTPDEIRHLRLRLDETQQEFAARLNVSARQVSRWENGESEPSKWTRPLLEQARESLETEAA